MNDPGRQEHPGRLSSQSLSASVPPSLPFRPCPLHLAAPSGRFAASSLLRARRPRTVPASLDHRMSMRLLRRQVVVVASSAAGAAALTPLARVPARGAARDVVPAYSTMFRGDL